MPSREVPEREPDEHLEQEACRGDEAEEVDEEREERERAAVEHARHRGSGRRQSTRLRSDIIFKCV